jgi:hypothetical protein
MSARDPLKAFSKFFSRTRRTKRTADPPKSVSLQAQIDSSGCVLGYLYDECTKIIIALNETPLPAMEGWNFVLYEGSHHNSAAAFSNAAKAGCGICRKLLALQPPNTYLVNDSSVLATFSLARYQFEIRVDLRQDWKPLATFKLACIEVMADTGLSSETASSLLRGIDYWNEGYNNTGCDKALDMAINGWLRHCLNSHKLCGKD